MTNPTADAAKLLPCPWCGNAPEIELNTVGYTTVACCHDDCPVAPIVAAGRTQYQAIAKWNTRPQPAPTTGEPDFDIMNGELEQEFYRTGGDRTHGYIRRYLVTRAYHLGLAARPTAQDGPLSKAQIEHMRDRFLGWRLPENFSPDAGISFKPTFNDHLPTPTKHEPVGTNLFDCGQAEAMVRYMIEGMPGLATRPKVEDAELSEHDEARALACIHSWDQNLLADHIGIDGSLLKQVAKLYLRVSAKLAEREAELAKDDWYIAGQHAHVLGPDYGTEEIIIEKACARHAARQQQKEGRDDNASRKADLR